MTERDWADAHLGNAAVDIHVGDPVFGYRSSPTNARGTASRRAKAGSSVCAASVHGIRSAFWKKRSLNRKPGHDDRVERAFTAAAPNELWLTDITGHPTSEGKLCLSAARSAVDRLAGAPTGHQDLGGKDLPPSEAKTAGKLTPIEYETINRTADNAAQSPSQQEPGQSR